jgi:hypothetical protein
MAATIFEGEAELAVVIGNSQSWSHINQGSQTPKTPTPYPPNESVIYAALGLLPEGDPLQRDWRRLAFLRSQHRPPRGWCSAYHSFRARVGAFLGHPLRPTSLTLVSEHLAVGRKLRLQERLRK